MGKEQVSCMYRCDSDPSTVLINGTAIYFEAHNIDGNNYFKLRDLAKAILGTGKQFEVTWDGG